MHSFLPVLLVFSRVLLAFATAFLVPLAWAWFLDAHHHALVWAYGFALTAASGLLLWFCTRRHRRELQTRDGFLLVNLVWIVLPVYAAVPLLFTVPDIGWSKAYFEAMSALTATGATALSGLDALPVSVNVWRCFLQLVGGLGIILLVVAAACIARRSWGGAHRSAHTRGGQEQRAAPSALDEVSRVEGLENGGTDAWLLFANCRR